MATNFPNGVSSFGIPLIGSGSQIPVSGYPGVYRFVSSVNGNDGNSGKTPKAAMATIAKALLSCTANNGDVIVLLPGHAETVSAAGGLTLNVAGVTIVGIGTGSLTPKITLDTATTSTVLVTSANITVRNVAFVANFAAIVTCFDVRATWLTINSCSFMDTTSSLNFLKCVIVSQSTANLCDGLTVTGCYREALATGALAFVSILGNVDRLTLKNNDVVSAGTGSVGHFLIAAALVLTGARIIGNTLTVVGATSATVGVFFTSSASTDTGIIALNYVSSLDTTSELLATTGTGMVYFENYYTGDADASGKLWPAAAAA